MTNDYRNLINKLLDRGEAGAAEYLKTEATKLRSFSDYTENAPDSVKLKRIFIWREAPQGHQFWQDICRELEAEEGGQSE